MSVVEQSVHGCAREQGVTEEVTELAVAPVRGDHSRASLVADTDDLVEVHGLVALQWTQSEVINDEQVG